MYFLRLALQNSAGDEMSRNFYWLSRKTEIPGLGLFDPFYLPTVQFADFKQLDELPRVKLSASSTARREGPQIVRTVTVSNPSASLAFSIRLKVNDPTGEEILPVLWQDNYFSLLPGESRTIEARYAGAGDQEQVAVSGWNVDP
jgi:exo-1,4-beta-D-glucosaminidase